MMKVHIGRHFHDCQWRTSRRVVSCRNASLPQVAVAGADLLDGRQAAEHARVPH